tara:strand:- start:22 stop:249 length:228 start_codon:yes stop_codon:yes gene_type:complete
MCFTLGGGGSRGDVTQNSYYGRRPWDDPTGPGPNRQALPGMYETAGSKKINTDTPTETTAPATPKRSSLTTGGSA